MWQKVYLFLNLSQNKFMTKKFAFYLMIMIICVGLLSSIFPYPIIQNSANITTFDSERINNYNETELNIEEADGEVKVSNLNWFDSVNSLFETYNKTRVIDIQSGETYYVYRIGGSNHADVEPIDSINTEIFHALYDYEYSWVRRPVWVEITDNMWVAGSINGYPHGQTYISGNNMEGHTCIHFLESKTHGTKRVDEAHQNCVNEAYLKRNKINEFLKKR